MVVLTNSPTCRYVAVTHPETGKSKELINNKKDMTRHHLRTHPHLSRLVARIYGLPLAKRFCLLTSLTHSQGGTRQAQLIAIEIVGK